MKIKLDHPSMSNLTMGDSKLKGCLLNITCLQCTQGFCFAPKKFPGLELGEIISSYENLAWNYF